MWDRSTHGPEIEMLREVPDFFATNAKERVDVGQACYMFFAQDQDIEAVHLPASFATFAARLSQICSNVRQPCLIMGKAAPALRQVSQKLRH